MYLMKKSYKFVFASFLMLASLYSVEAFAQRAYYTAPDNIVKGQVYTVSFSFEAEKDVKINSITWGPESLYEELSGPETSRSMSFSIINGKSSRKVTNTYTYTFTAKETGSFVINELHIDPSLEGQFTEMQRVPEKEKSTTAGAQANNNSSSGGQKGVSSIGRRTDNVGVLNYSAKSKVVSNITGWCYNTQTNKWVGHKQYIHFDVASEKPNILSAVCYSLQMCMFEHNGAKQYVLRWKGETALDKSVHYLVFSERQFNQLKNVGSKGVILQAVSPVLLEQPESEDKEIRNVLNEVSSNIYVGVRCDEGNVVRFKRSEKDSNGEFVKMSDGTIDFPVESSKTKIQGYFEVPLPEWQQLFNL